jgi:EAL domain-containing protein (putative c-di-GMP-specific phosphodiesterase class I)
VRARQSTLSEPGLEHADWSTIFKPAAVSASRLPDNLASQLPGAIAAGLILPFYQPIVDLVDGTIVGLEVLARWRHPDLGLLRPDAFVPAADDARASGSITSALMRRVVIDAQAWPSHLFFAFNVSPKQLGDITQTVAEVGVECWPEWTLDPGRLEIEITECGPIEDIGAATRAFAFLQAYGTRIVLDDFGTGESNLSRLRDIRFDKIKIDRGFLIGMGQDSRAEACLCAMLDVGARLGVLMVAEGLEHVDVASRVAAMGCRYGQGYLYSRPVPAETVPALFSSIPFVRPLPLLW